MARLAQNEMKAKCAMPLRVRSMEGLGRRRMLDPDALTWMMLRDGFDGIGHCHRWIRTRNRVDKASDVLGGQDGELRLGDRVSGAPDRKLPVCENDCLG